MFDRNCDDRIAADPHNTCSSLENPPEGKGKALNCDGCRCDVGGCPAAYAVAGSMMNCEDFFVYMQKNRRKQSKEFLGWTYAVVRNPEVEKDNPEYPGDEVASYDKDNPGDPCKRIGETFGFACPGCNCQAADTCLKHPIWMGKCGACSLSKDAKGNALTRQSACEGAGGTWSVQDHTYRDPNKCRDQGGHLHMSEMSCDDMLADSPRRYSCSMLTQKPYYFNCAGCTCKPPPCAEHNMPSCEGKYCALVGKDADGKQEVTPTGEDKDACKAWVNPNPEDGKKKYWTNYQARTKSSCDKQGGVWKEERKTCDDMMQEEGGHKHSCSSLQLKGFHCEGCECKPPICPRFRFLKQDEEGNAVEPVMILQRRTFAEMLLAPLSPRPGSHSRALLCHSATGRTATR